MNLIKKAKKLAKEKHGGDKRKYDEKKDYYSHPQGVAKRLQQFKSYKHNQEVIAAAYLHDILEETNMKYKELKSLFNEQIADLVKELTSDSSKYSNTGDESKYLAKAKYLTDKINNMSEDARVIKLADRTDNVSDLSAAPQSFSDRYAKETGYILTHIQFIPNEVEKQLIESIWKYIRPFLN